MNNTNTAQKKQAIPDFVAAMMVALARGKTLQRAAYTADRTAEWKDLSTLDALHCLPHLLEESARGGEARSVRIKEPAA